MAKRKKDLEGLIDSLSKENSSLKKKISKLRKLISSNNLDSEVDAVDETTEEVVLEEMPKKCAKCGGEVKEVKIMNLSFVICQKCKNRTKLSK